MDHSLDQVVKDWGIIGEVFFVVKSPFLRGSDRPFLLMMGLLYRGQKRLSRAGVGTSDGPENAIK